ncbi:single- stranded DNA-binding family protein [Thermococcus sp. 2319x1]|uniref:single- stranded DNA-binding family protein n=1 Tax=Thermococcus sp. 2319x1 TaxID=1674923 RepID=UPI00158327E4|nr:single- stranded DNA-binding family protein [Thermococcus sp. 2319x1]
MPRLSTGFVRASGYANKVRKVLFALTRGKLNPEEVVRASAQLNQYLFDKLQEMGVKKEDVVRISIGFDIKNEEIEWNYDTLRIEVYKKEEEEKLAEAMREVEESEKALEIAIDELSKLSEKLRELSNEIAQTVERLKREHTSLKLEFEK